MPDSRERETTKEKKHSQKLDETFKRANTKLGKETTISKILHSHVLKTLLGPRL